MRRILKGDALSPLLKGQVNYHKQGDNLILYILGPSSQVLTKIKAFLLKSGLELISQNYFKQIDRTRLSFKTK